MPERERDIILVFGKTGMGKSRWTRAYLKGQRRVMVVDPMREHDGILFEDLSELINHVQEYPTFRVRTEWPDEVNPIAAVAMAVNDPRRFEGKKIPELTFVVEESQRCIPVRGEMHPAMSNVILRGRHHHVTLLAVAQRPTTVHIHARSQWTRMVVFHQSEGADTTWLEKQTEIPGEEFNRLKPGEYYDVTPLDTARMVLADQVQEKMAERPTERGPVIGKPAGGVHVHERDDGEEE